MSSTLTTAIKERKDMAKDTNQVVEVVFPSGGKNYSYIGNGNLRVGQKISNAPVNHYKTGTPYTAPVEVVATHEVVGAEVGKNIGVSNGMVHTIPKPLKYLAGARTTKESTYRYRWARYDSFTVYVTF